MNENKYLAFCKAELAKNPDLIRARLIELMSKHFESDFEVYSLPQAEYDFIKHCAPFLKLKKGTQGGTREQLKKRSAEQNEMIRAQAKKLLASFYFDTAEELAEALKAPLSKQGFILSAKTIESRISQFKLFKK